MELKTMILATGEKYWLVKIMTCWQVEVPAIVSNQCDFFWDRFSLMTVKMVNLPYICNVYNVPVFLLRNLNK